MKVVVLASSSEGNSTYVEMNNIKFLIDVGLNYQTIIDKLNEIDVNIIDINFIIITHAHTDHIKNLYAFYRKHNIPIYVSKDTYEEIKFKDKIKEYNDLNNIDEIFGLTLYKVPISHDKKGFGFVFESENHSLVYITDTGMIHSKYHEILKNREVYVFESNHDVEMEMNGSKDYITKIRNIGDSGHLSNNDCSKYLSLFVGPDTKYVILAHISEEDNEYSLAYNTTREVLDKRIEVLLSDKVKSSQVISV